MNMNYGKGFRFHPTDQEAIELLYDKRVIGRDSIVQQVGGSVVQAITQLKDICDFEPWELPGRSELESGDSAWYFFCSPTYKYSKSERKNRLTKKGYWNITGNLPPIVTMYDGKEITGTKKILVFYRGRACNKKKENKTDWVIHEFELTLNLPDIKNIILCKLKLKKKSGKVDVSRGEEGQSSHSSPSNVEYHSTNDAIPEDQLNSNEPLTEPEAFNENSGIQSQSTTNEQDDEDELVRSFLIDDDDEMIHTEQRSNQPFFVVENEGSKLPSEFQNFEDAHIQKKQEDFGEKINQKPKGTDGCVGTQDQVYVTSEHDNSSRSSILTANNQSYSKEGSNQHNLFADQNESSTLSFDSIPMENSEFKEFLLRSGFFMDELLSVPETAKNPHGVEHGQFSTNERDDEFSNSTFFTTDEVEAYMKEQNLVSVTGGFDFPSTSTMELPYDLCSMESSRKRRRVESEGLSSETDIPSGSGKTCEEGALV